MTGPACAAAAGRARRPARRPGRPRRTHRAARRSTDRQDRTGVADDVVELGAGRRRAERHQHGTAAQHGDQRLDGGERGPGAPQHPVARARHPFRPAPRPARRCGRRASPRPPSACGPIRRSAPEPSGRAAQRGRPHLRQRPTRHRGAARPATVRRGRAPSPPATAGHSLAVMTARRIAIVPHTHWDREWYKSYQDFRLALVELDRHAAPPARARRQLPPLHAGRADGRGGRLPRGAPRGRGAAPGAGRRRSGQHGALVHPDGRVPRLGRDDRAQPADGPRYAAPPSGA